jgi:hypothetical protein
MIREPDVIAVRVGDPGDESFYRADVQAPSSAVARTSAPAPASSVARRLGLAQPLVRSVLVTDDPDAVPEGFARALAQRASATR